MDLAARSAAAIRIVEVELDPVDVGWARERLRSEVATRDVGDVEISIDVRLAYEHVAHEIVAAASLVPDAVVVMSSVGRGRSAAIVGSVAQDVLRQSQQPVVLVGPKAATSGFHGSIIVTTDGSLESEAALPVASQWANDLDAPVVISTVGDPHAGWLPNVFMADGSMTRLVERLRQTTHADVDIAVLAGPNVGRAVVDHAHRCSASLIVASSHGRGGLSRLVLGSVAAHFVRRAPCPVIVVHLTSSAV